MTLSAGTRLGPYEITAPLGAGGMGEVYRARDTRLGRTVAIKIVRSDLSTADDLRRRFETEARAISNLNHPHICTLFDVGHEKGVDYLVMEHLEGETLSHRLERGPLPVGEVLRHAMEIAEALDAAHAQGIVHRDLKPGNVMLTESGAKLLDFGLARLRGESIRATSSAVSSLPTESVEEPLTARGMVLGTIHYMAPEQIEGKGIDDRTDIFALGQVIYEMATGRKAFEGSTSAAVAAAILKTEPPSISQVRPDLPPALDHLVHQCLVKNPERRWRSAHDLALQLRWIRDGRLAPDGAAQTTARMARRARLGWIAAAFAGLICLALVLAGTLSPRAPALGPTVRFTVDSPEGATVVEPYWSHPALSPDGRSLAFMAFTSGRPTIWVRPLDGVSSRPLPGTEGGVAPFWSPDGRWIAFFAEGRLKKTQLGSAASQTLCEVPGAAACGSWSRNGTILFCVREAPPGQNGLYRISDSGGATSRIPIRSAREDAPFFPHFLPDGRRFLIGYADSTGAGVVAVGTLDAPGLEPLADFIPTSRVQYAPPGYLISARENTLVAHRFDAASARVRGEPIPIAENVLQYGDAASFSVSESGVLAYRPPGTRARWLAWYGRTGRPLETVGGPAAYIAPRISPDGRRFAVVIEDPRTELGRVWIYEIPQGNPARLSDEDIDSYYPIWSPDGRDIALSMPMGGPPNLVLVNLATKNVEVIAPSPDRLQGACDWSSDGRVIAYAERDPKSGIDLWSVSPGGDRRPVPILRTRFQEDEARFSPDSRWITYSSDESGQFEVYIQPFPGPGEKRRVSSAGGSIPCWSGDGKEIFYVTPGRDLMSVPMDGASGLPTGPPRLLFRVTSQVRGYDVSKDGERFLIARDAETSQPPIHVVVNWAAGIRDQ